MKEVSQDADKTESQDISSNADAQESAQCNGDDEEGSKTESADTELLPSKPETAPVIAPLTVEAVSKLDSLKVKPCDNDSLIVNPDETQSDIDSSVNEKDSANEGTATETSDNSSKTVDENPAEPMDIDDKTQMDSKEKKGESKPSEKTKSPEKAKSSEKSKAQEKVKAADKSKPQEKAKPLEKSKSPAKAKPAEKTKTPEKAKPVEKAKSSEKAKPSEKTKTPEKAKSSEKTKPSDKAKTSEKTSTAENATSDTTATKQKRFVFLIQNTLFSFKVQNMCFTLLASCVVTYFHF